MEIASIPVIYLMLSRGGNVQKGQPLHHAVERQSDIIEILGLLIEHGAPINSTMYEDHYPSRALFQFMGLGIALHKAAELGKADVVRYLISQTIEDTNGSTATGCAPLLNKWEVVEILEKEK